MLKIDKPIVDEFLGKDVDITLDVCSKLKCFRAYGKGQPLSEIIYVLTPMMAEDDEFLKTSVEFMALGGSKYEYKTHKRGKNTVVTFKKC